MLRTALFVFGLAGVLALPPSYDRTRRDLGDDLTSAFSSMAKPVGDIYVGAMKNATNALGEGFNEMSKATKDGLNEVAEETKSKDGSGTDFSSLFKTDSSKPSFSSRSSFNRDDNDWPSRHSKNFGENSSRSSLFDDSSFGHSSLFDRDSGFGRTSTFGNDPFKSSFGNSDPFQSSFRSSSGFGNNRNFGSPGFRSDSGFGSNRNFGSSGFGSDSGYGSFSRHSSFEPSRTTEPYGKYW